MPETATIEQPTANEPDPAAPASEVSVLRPALPVAAPAPDPKVAADREARSQAAFEALRDNKPIPLPVTRDDKGRFAPIPGEKPSETPPPEGSVSATMAEPTAASQTASDPKTTPDPEAVKAARRALLRDEWEPEDIEALPAERLLKLGSTRAAAQAKLDRRMEQLKAGVTTTAAEPEAEPEPPMGLLDQVLYVPAAPTHGAAAGATGTDPLAKLSGLVDDELLAEVKGALEHERAATQRNAQIAQKAIESAAVSRIHSARDRLASEFKGILDDPEKADAVFTAMGLLDPQATVLFRGSPADLEGLMRKAVHAEFAEEIKQQSHAQRVAANREALKGSPDIRTGPTATPGGRKPSSEDVMKAKFQAIQEVGHTDPSRINSRVQQILSGAAAT